MKTKFNHKAYYLLIPLVSIAIWSIYQLQGIGANKCNGPLMSVMHTSGLWLGCYLTVGYLWKRFPWEHNPLKHLLLEIILIGIYTNLFIYASWKLIPEFSEIKTDNDIFQSFLQTNLITYLITAIHEAVYFYRQWMDNFSKSIRLEKENILSKYETLKNQVNPHFLFNSLNSLTALVEGNQQAESYIQNLSNFLRYVLKSRDRELVTLSEELEMLNSYIALQKVRSGDNIVFNIDPTIEHYSNLELPPLALQMLVENCIKHNIASLSQKLYINIKANSKFVSVENNIQLRMDEPSTKLGLINLKERYQFFTKQPLVISTDYNYFKVEIPLLSID